MNNKLTSWEDAQSSSTKWKKYLGESKVREKQEQKATAKRLKESQKRFAKEVKNPKLYK